MKKNEVYYSVSYKTPTCAIFADVFTLTMFCLFIEYMILKDNKGDREAFATSVDPGLLVHLRSLIWLCTVRKTIDGRF